jgi:serine phosphatase RsbU (regulator of sigma subunit)
MKAGDAGRTSPKTGRSDMGATVKPRAVRVGLATKITLPVATLSVVVIAIFGAVVNAKLADGLDEELDRTGVFAARLAASPEIDSWLESYNTVDDLRRRLAEIEAEFAVARSVLSTPTTTLGAEERDVAAKLGRYDEARRAFNRRRLERLRGADGALDVLITDSKDQIVATAAGLKKASFRPWHRRAIGDTTIESSLMTTSAGDELPVRTFTHPIVDRKRAEIGKATVVFSEAGLEAQMADLRDRILLFCLFGALACGAVAFGTSRVVTAPLKRLHADVLAVSRGDLTHRTFARSNDEIGAVATAFDAMTRDLERAEGVRLELEDRDRQAELGREVQERLFPTSLPTPSGLSLDAAKKTSGELSSDLFDVLPTPDGRVALLVMTTSGSGVPAAIVLSMARSLARAVSERETEPRRVLIELNRLLSPDLKRGFYVSALCAAVDPSTGEAVLASAGSRAPALHVLSARHAMRSVQPDGIALGLDRGPVFEKSLQEARFTLDDGDSLVMFTEGALKLLGPEGTPLGDEAFKRTALAEARRSDGAGLATRVLDAFAAKLSPTPGPFDATVVTVVRAAKAAS